MSRKPYCTEFVFRVYADGRQERRARALEIEGERIVEARPLTREHLRHLVAARREMDAPAR